MLDWRPHRYYVGSMISRRGSGIESQTVRPGGDRSGIVGSHLG